MMAMANVCSHSSLWGLRQFSHDPARPNGVPSLMDGIGLLGPGAFGCAPLEETIHGNDAALASVGIAEQTSDRLSALALIGLRPPLGFCTNGELFPLW